MPDLFYNAQLSTTPEGAMVDPVGGKFSLKRGAKAVSKAGKTLTTKRQRKMVGDAAAERAASFISGSGHCTGGKFSLKKGAKAVSKAGKTLTTKRQRRMVGDAAAERAASFLRGSGHCTGGDLQSGQERARRLMKRGPGVLKKMKKSKPAVTKAAKTLTTKRQRKMVGDAAADSRVAGMIAGKGGAGAVGGACGH